MFKQTVSANAVLTAIGLSPIASMNIASAQDETPTNEYWWPNRLDLTPLRTSAAASNPLDASFNYAEAFKTVDVEQLKKDLAAVMTTSQDWWPADYGHYGPFFIRMSWHSAGTYRTVDGRGGGDGGMQRFAPLNSWPDNGNLDKARRLLWPLKQKYGNAVSWSDLIAFAGTIAMEDMGFKIEGFAFGREDAWEPEEVNWGPEGEWLAREGRHDANGKLKKPFGAARMGLIYVNPEGPNGNPDPLLAANEIRDTFGRMAMNDEETIALIAGGHTFGKAHGAARGENLGKEPEAASLEQQGLGWKNKYGTGKGGDTITSGLEGAWTVSPTQWTHNFFQNLFEYDWKLTKSPAGAHQWIPTDEYAGELVPDAHDLDKRHAPIMLTTDLALKEDPGFRAVSERFYNNPEEFEKAFARAWFKLTHRDMGPRTRYLGSLVPSDERIWQDPVPAVDHKLVDTRDVINLKAKILASGVSVPELVRTAWSSASSYRDTDKRGGTNGARIRLAPQNDWEANSPAELAKVLKALEAVQSDFNKAQSDGTKISLADMIVLGGAAAIEQAAKNAGQNITVPFKPGRTDASQAMTDVASFDFLKPAADGFRNYFENGNDRSPAAMLVEKAALLNLSVPEMTVLVGGMRALDANTSGAEHGVFTSRPGTLSNDYFVNLLDMSTEWKKSSRIVGVYEGADRRTGAQKWTATPVDLIFGSNSELRAVAEFYGLEGAQATFLEDFAEAWTKVMNLGRFDLQ